MWIAVLIAIWMSMLFDSDEPQHTLYSMVALVTFVFLFTVSRLVRSAAPVVLLLFAFFAEFGLLTIFRSGDMTVSLDPLPLRLIEDLSVIAVVGALLLLAWGMAKLPDAAFPAAVKSALWSWIGLERATAIVMLAISTSAAAATFDTLYHDVYPNVTMNANTVRAILRSLPVKETSFPLTFTYDDPDELINPKKTVSWNSWNTKWLPEIVDDIAYQRGAFLVVPRGLTTMLGFGAFAAVAGFVIASARRWDVRSGGTLLAWGLGGSLLVHQAWTAFAGTDDSMFLLATAALVAGLILIAACIYAVDLDRRSGLADIDAFLGTSFVTPAGPKPPALAP